MIPRGLNKLVASVAKLGWDFGGDKAMRTDNLNAYNKSRQLMFRKRLLQMVILIVILCDSLIAEQPRDKLSGHGSDDDPQHTHPHSHANTKIFIELNHENLQCSHPLIERTEESATDHFDHARVIGNNNVPGLRVLAGVGRANRQSVNINGLDSRSFVNIGDDHALPFDPFTLANGRVIANANSNIIFDNLTASNYLDPSILANPVGDTFSGRYILGAGNRADGHTVGGVQAFGDIDEAWSYYGSIYGFNSDDYRSSEGKIQNSDSDITSLQVGGTKRFHENDYVAFSYSNYDRQYGLGAHSHGHEEHESHDHEEEYVGDHDDHEDDYDDAHNDHDEHSYENEIEEYVDIFDNYQKLSLSGRMDHDGNQLSFDSQLKLSKILEGSMSETDFWLENKAWDSRIDYATALRSLNSKLSVGLVTGLAQYENLISEPFLPNTDTLSSSLYATLESQDQFEWTHGVKVGFRSFDIDEGDEFVGMSDRDFYTYGLSSQVGFHLTETHNLGGTVGLNASSRAPDVFELYSNGRHAGIGDQFGNGQLRTEKVYGFNGAITYTHDDISFKLKDYIQLYDDFINLVTQDDDSLVFDRTNALVNTASAELIYHALEDRAGDIDFDYLIENNWGRDLRTDRFLPRIAPIRQVFGASHRYGPTSSRVSLTLVSSQNQLGLNEESTKGFKSLDISNTTQLFEGTDLVITGFNLLNDKIEYHTTLNRDLAFGLGRGVKLMLQGQF